jgi:hypothetical protein
MAFTDHSDIYGALNEAGVNLVLQHVQLQRPSLFNYGTQQVLDKVAQNPQILCAPIETIPNVGKRNNPLIGVEDPLVIPGTDNQLAVSYLAQLTKLQLDLHPGGVFTLPPELSPPLAEQHFALHVQVCGGIGCPTQDFLDNYALPEPKTDPARATTAAAFGKLGDLGNLGNLGTLGGGLGLPGGGGKQTPTVVPFDTLTCFCVDLFVLGNFKPAGQTIELLLQPAVDGVELVDIAPTGLENILECMMVLLIKIVVLPKLAKAIKEALVSPLKDLKDQASLTLIPTPTPASIPNNPAVVDDQVKIFVNLKEV